MITLRDACVAKAHELGMGIVAMKVMGAGMLAAWSGYLVPGFDKQRLPEMRPAFRARSVNTVWTTSSANSAFRIWRKAAWYTIATCRRTRTVKASSMPCSAYSRKRCMSGQSFTS